MSDRPKAGERFFGVDMEARERRGGLRPVRPVAKRSGEASGIIRLDPVALERTRAELLAIFTPAAQPLGEKSGITPAPLSSDRPESR